MMLVALKGFAGSGKSTLGRALGRELGWPVIDKDDIKDVLDGHTPEANRLSYDIMLNVARRQLLQGTSVICDSPLNFRTLYEAAERVASETGALLVVIECCCPDEDVWSERINARKSLGLPSHHQTDWGSFQEYRQRVLPQTSYPITSPHLALETTRPLEELVAEALAWLQAQSDRDASG